MAIGSPGARSNRWTLLDRLFILNGARKETRELDFGAGTNMPQISPRIGAVCIEKGKMGFFRMPRPVHHQHLMSFYALDLPRRFARFNSAEDLANFHPRP